MELSRTLFCTTRRGVQAVKRQRNGVRHVNVTREGLFTYQLHGGLTKTSGTDYVPRLRLCTVSSRK